MAAPASSLPSANMTRREWRAGVGLASIYGLRMLGLFLILPVFTFYAESIEGGNNQLLVGVALGAYGLTQALFQLPFGMLSDRIGRKRVIYFGLLLFALGSLIAAEAETIDMVIVGRAIQGAGAISAAITALMADLTREEHRTKAMAMIGSSIGVTFALSLVLGPALNAAIGVPGIFALTAILALVGIWVVAVVVPRPHHSIFHSDAEARAAKLGDVLKDGELLRLNFGIFALHAVQMAMFVVIPVALRDTGGLDPNQHWMVYLPVMLASFIVMVPAIIYGERRGRIKLTFLAAITLLLAAHLMLVGLTFSFDAVVLYLVLFFIAFNILEASLPSLVSKIAPPSAKGTALGVYNTSQSLGLFAGGVVGGYLAHTANAAAVFIFSSGLVGLWLFIALTMRNPPALRTQLFHLEGLDAVSAAAFAQQAREIEGVHDVMVVPDENLVYLKVSVKGWQAQRFAELMETYKQQLSGEQA